MKAFGPLRQGTRTINLNRRNFLFWPTTSTVTEVIPEKKLAFRVNTNNTIWSYELEPTEQGTRVVESRHAENGVKPSANFTVECVVRRRAQLRTRTHRRHEHLAGAHQGGGRKLTGTPAEEQRLRDLKLLRRVRDRMDREYAQPLDVEALARGVNMSAGHLSRQFKIAYGESPYSYLMTRRIERAMALLRRGDMSVTEVCFAVGCSSLGTFSTRFTELVGMPPSAYREQTAGVTRGNAVVRGETGDQTDQESRSARHRGCT